MKRAALAALVLLVGCGMRTDPVYLKHPNGTVVQCGPYDTMIAGQAEASVIRERGCIEDYQRQGFQRVPRP